MPELSKVEGKGVRGYLGWHWQLVLGKGEELRSVCSHDAKKARYGYCDRERNVFACMNCIDDRGTFYWKHLPRDGLYFVEVVEYA